MFGKIKKIVRNYKSLTLKYALFQLFLDNEFKALIIELNTQEQLYKGINSKGVQLAEIGGEYSPYTVMLKRDKGQVVDKVTLRDTGYFYESFKLFFKVEGDGYIQIEADTIKENGVDLIDRWGRDIIGLSEESLSKLRDLSLSKLNNIVNKRLFE